MDKRQIIKRILLNPSFELTDQEVGDIYSIIEPYAKGQYKTSLEAQVTKLQDAINFVK